MWKGEVLDKVRVTTYVAADRQYTSSIEVIAAHGFACDSAVNCHPLGTDGDVLPRMRRSK